MTPRPLQAISLLVALLVLFILSKSYFTPYSLQTAIGMASEVTASSLASRYEDWHSRTKAHPSFTPTRAALSLAVLGNTPVELEGFILALFDAGDDKVTVDAMGRVLLVSDADYAGVVELARQMATELPETGRFRNTWVIKHATTSQLIERLLLVVDGQLKETSVQGFVKTMTELKTPVGDIDELPDVLSEVAGLVLEERMGYSEMVQKVKDILNENVLL